MLPRSFNSKVLKASCVLAPSQKVLCVVFIKLAEFYWSTIMYYDCIVLKPTASTKYMLDIIDNSWQTHYKRAWLVNVKRCWNLEIPKDIKDDFQYANATTKYKIQSVNYNGVANVFTQHI